MPQPWGGWDGRGDEGEHESEAVLAGLDDV